MTRKKRNTWQPNEITSIIRSSQDSLTDTKTTGETVSSSPQALNDTVPHESDTQSSEDFHVSTNVEVATPTDISAKAVAVEKACQSAETVPELLSISDSKGRDGNATRRNFEAGEEHSTTIAAPSHNAKFSVVDTDGTSGNAQATRPDGQKNKIEEQEETVSTPSRKFKRTSSMVRLSMSLDGKASVILKGDTPSPPSKQPASRPVARSSLQRSKSLVSGQEQLAAVQSLDKPTVSIPRAYGRSKDARTWEFYCDSDARESLTRTADNEQRGSAAGRIPLIRSGSASRQPLSMSSSRQNAQIAKLGSSKRKVGSGLEKPKAKLARTASSYARLQSMKDATMPNMTELDTKASTQPAVLKDSSGDSDKENWEPGSQHSNMRTREPRNRPVGPFDRGILQESNSVPSESSSLGALMDREKLRARRAGEKAGLDKANLHADDEVSSFTGGPKPQGEDDMDAVQSLLSLSHGAWA